MSVFTPDQPHFPIASPHARRLRRALAVVTGPAVATAVWAIEVPLAGVHLGVHVGPSSPEVLGVGPVVAASVVAGLAGWAALEIVEARAHNPRRTWSILALAVLGASLALPLAAAIGAAAVVALIGLHLAVGGTVIPQLRASTSSSTRHAGRPDGAPTPDLRSRASSHTAALVILAALVAGGAFAAVTGAASASGFGPPAGGPFARTVGAAATGRWAARSRASLGRSTGLGWGGSFGHPFARDTERFEVESTNPTGPGVIIVTGVANAGGVEHPGRAIDSASFADGSFRIDHASGRPTEAFNPATCVGSISQVGTFEVIDGTGRFTDLSGSGRYVFRATYTTARGTTGCTRTAVTAYEESIDGVVHLAPQVVRQLTSRRA